MTHPYLIMAAWLILSNVILYRWMRWSKRKRRAEQREKIIHRLLDYPLDCFPRERYELGPLDMIIVRDLVDKR